MVAAAGLLMLGGAFLMFTGIIGLAVEQPTALRMFLLGLGGVLVGAFLSAGRDAAREGARLDRRLNP